VTLSTIKEVAITRMKMHAKEQW